MLNNAKYCSEMFNSPERQSQKFHNAKVLSYNPEFGGAKLSKAMEAKCSAYNPELWEAICCFKNVRRCVRRIRFHPEKAIRARLWAEASPSENPVKERLALTG
jgi:hypothetical protein